MSEPVTRLNPAFYGGRIRSGLLVGLLWLAASACGSEPAGLVETDAVDLGVAGDGDLALVLEEIRARWDQPAMSAMLIRDGSIIESVAVGLRAREYPELVTDEDQWRVGSLTKAMTATLAAVLVERGAIEWETTIGEIFPDLDSIFPEYVEVRLDEVLSHTGGLPDLRSFDNYSSRHDLVASLLQVDASSPRRGTWDYSNAGYMLAGAMLEEVTGQTWETMVHAELFDPLGMADSGFGPPAWSPTDREQPVGHYLEGDTWLHVTEQENPVIGPAGTVHVTLEDYAAWLTAHLRGANGTPGLISAESFNKLHSAVPESATNTVVARADGYGLGWFVAGPEAREWLGGPALFHTGSGFGWVAEVWLVPSRGLALVAFGNAIKIGYRQVVHEAIEALLSRHDAAFGRP